MMAATSLSAEERDRLMAEDQARRDAEFWAQDACNQYRARLGQSRAPKRHLEVCAPAEGEPTLVPHDVFMQTLRWLVDGLGTSFIRALISEERGPGKTQLAACLINQVCGCDRTARYTTAMEFFRGLRDTFGQHSEMTEARYLRQFAAFDLLVIDEIQVRGGSKWEQDTLTTFIDKRYHDSCSGMMKDTLFIGNLSPAGLRDCVGRSIASRMEETGAIKVCAWPSWRKKKGGTA